MIDSTYEDKLYQTPKFAGAVRYNAQKNCAALSCRALRRVARMCSSTVSDTANRSRNGSTLCSPTIEKILCRSPISERSHVGNLRQTKKQRETGVKRVETAGVYPLAPPRGAARSRRGGGESPRSAERNSPLRFSKKDCRPDRVNRPRGSSTPLGRCRKGAARQGRTR